MKWTSYGPDALLIEFADRVGDDAFARGRALVAALEADPPEGMREFVPAFTTLLLEFDPEVVPDPRVMADALVARLEAAGGKRLPPVRLHQMEVVYDGPDLRRVAELNQLTVEEVCRLHGAEIYKVYMLGFSPGFPYLGDLDPRLHTPRLESPRARIAAGSVAIGGRHTGIYSVDSPGGWNIIGHTRERLFHPEAEVEGVDAMFALRQGDCVKFVGVDRL